MKLLVLIVLLFNPFKCQENGFLEDFFQRFPHLPFAHLNNQNSDLLFEYLIKKRDIKPAAPTLVTASTTTTTVSTTSTTVRTKSLPPEDIWFGSTPRPLYREYVNDFHNSKPLRFIKSQRLGKPVQENHPATTEEVYPFELIKLKLQEPSYMTNPKFTLTTTKKPLFGSDVEFDYHKGSESTTAQPQPNEIKSLPPSPTIVPTIHSGTF